jgi:hypothetical protein
MSPAPNDHPIAIGSPQGTSDRRLLPLAALRNLLTNADAVRSIMLTYSTQTNEPARCATLLPAFAQLPQPLALIEVGASAGLFLVSDFYAYDYTGYVIQPRDAEIPPPLFTCSTNAATLLPATLPQIVWRAGLDLGQPVEQLARLSQRLSSSLQSNVLPTMAGPSKKPTTYESLKN